MNNNYEERRKTISLGNKFNLYISTYILNRGNIRFKKLERFPKISYKYFLWKVKMSVKRVVRFSLGLLQLLQQIARKKRFRKLAVYRYFATTIGQ